DVEQREGHVADAARLRKGNRDVDVLATVRKAPCFDVELQVVLGEVAVHRGAAVDRIAGGKWISRGKRSVGVSQRQGHADRATADAIASSGRTRGPGLLVPVQGFEDVM